MPAEKLRYLFLVGKRESFFFGHFFFSMRHACPHSLLQPYELYPLLDLLPPLGRRDPPDVGEQGEHLATGQHLDDGVELGAVADHLEEAGNA